MSKNPEKKYVFNTTTSTTTTNNNNLYNNNYSWAENQHIEMISERLWAWRLGDDAKNSVSPSQEYITF